MIGYGKLGLLIECMKKLLLVLVLFGSLGSIAFNRLLQTHGCCTFSPTKLHFVPNFLSTHRFPEKQRFLFWHIACQVTCPEAIEVSREVFIIDMGGEET